MKNRYELIGVAIRQRPEHHGIEHSEDGRGGADAERQRRESNEAEGRRASEHPHRESYFAMNGVDEFHEGALAHGFLVDLLCESAIGFEVPEPSIRFRFGL